ncbi:hypothetical protein M2171_002571 [Bradyrhizobium japonicum USDA 38]|uniref:hypothetical protein n=1 Tax=Bradyrhizobium japonicum TaxID=375 RepID=UPI00041FDB20|nr:hypothetical protein [Bradyrhizobium japonicum]MCS3893438.1 hypothetical protein [Bradyrhizobium japonicum USDA 38]MCS3945952.1 hypothetical protein [Bradyrhizobium japonicum]
MSGDSHTNFNSGAFTAGAATGALAVAGAMVASLQAAANANATQWARYERDQLERFLDLSELLREHAVRRAEAAEGELRKMKMLTLKRAGRLARA